MTDEQKDKRIAELEHTIEELVEDFVPAVHRHLLPDERITLHIKAGHLRKAASLIASSPASEPDAPRIDAAKLAEIRERHEAIDLETKTMTGSWRSQAHADRGTLLEMIGGQRDDRS